MANSKHKNLRTTRKDPLCTCGIPNNPKSKLYHITEADEEGYCIYCDYAAVYGLEHDKDKGMHLHKFNKLLAYRNAQNEDKNGDRIERKQSVTQTRPPKELKWELFNGTESLGKFSSVAEAAMSQNIPRTAHAKSYYFNKRSGLKIVKLKEEK